MATYDLMNYLDNHFDKQTMVCNLEEAFHQASTKCLNYELAQTNSLMKAQLTYKHNVVRRTSALVFVQTRCREVQIPDAAERGACAKELLSEILKFEECEVHTNLTKHEVIEKINELKHKID